MTACCRDGLRAAGGRRMRGRITVSGGLNIECIVVEDSPAGVSAAHAAGMVPIGFIGGNHTNPSLGTHLLSAGARAVIADMRALKSTTVALRGW